MYLRDFYQNNLWKRKQVIYRSHETYKREVIDANHDGIASVNCNGESLIVIAKNMLREYKIGQNEAYAEVDKPSKIGLMMSVVLDLIRDGKLRYFREGMIDSGTINRFITDMDILRMEGKIDLIKDCADTKLADLYVIVQAYLDKLDKLGLYDEYNVLDEITKLIWENKIHPSCKIIGIYKDALDNFSLKEREFWEAYTDGIEAEIIERFETTLEEAAEKQFFRVFGLHNEIHFVIKDVLKRNIPWEQVQIVTSNTSGFYPIETYLQQQGIPCCIPEGLSERYGYASSHIQKYINNKANLTIDSDGNISTSEMFEGLADRLEYVASNPNLLQPEINSLLSKAASCRRNAINYDFNANYYVVSRMVEAMLLGGSMLCDVKEEGAVYIASLRHTDRAFRPYVYLMGFESRNYPGDDIQSPVLMDNDMESIGLPDRYQSCKQREELQERLNRIMASGAKLVTISYSSYDTVNMREQSPSAFYQSELNASGRRESVFGFGDDSLETVLEAREWILQK